MSTPTAFDEASASLAAGMFAEAARRLSGSFDPAREDHCLLMAEARWRLGQLGPARDALDRCHNATAPSVVQARWFQLHGLLCREEGRPHEELDALRESVRLASQSASLRQLCVSQIALFTSILDRQGAQASESIAAEARQNVIRSGDGFLFGSLHARFAEFEVRRGNYERAFRHVEAGFRNVERMPNAWLTGLLWLAKSGCQATVGSIAPALRSARRARDAAKVSGHERMRCNALANIAFLSLWSNDFAQADAALADIGDAFKGSPMWFPVVESRSLRALCGGDLEASENHIRAGEVEIRVQGLPAHSWQCIELALARARLDAARGQCAAALNVLDQKIGSVERRGDPYLQAEWALESAWLALRCGDSSRARRGVDDLVGLTKPTDAGRRGDIHWLLGHVSMIDGDKIGGAIEFKRAQRIWAELGGHHPLRTIPDEYLEGPEGNIRVNGSEGAIATLLGMGGRPRLLGIQGAELIGVGEDALRVRVLAGPAGSRRTIYDSHVADTDPPRSPSHIVQLGEQDGVPYQLQVHAADLPGCRTRVVSLVGLIEAAVGMARLRREDQQRTSLWPAEEGLMLEGNVFVAPRMRELQATARRVGPSDLPVLITGETGSGKEVLGREVHDSSPRAAKGFAALVCSGVPREMLDSHLFGHRRGAFTGAVENFLGVIRANEGGTLLLDEIGEVSLDLQVKLLRFLETGEVHPLGETKPVKVDVRIVAATNQPLETLMKEGRFRQDLFYRLNVVRLTIPPLRERREEILPFFERFLMRECARMGRPVPDVSDEAIEHLLLYTWPGNVRQLLNEVKRILATLPPNAEITPAVLAGDITAERQAAIEKAVAASPTQMLVRTDQSLQAAIDQVERAMLKQALDTSPDLETAASKLDITRKGLFLKRQRLGLA